MKKSLFLSLLTLLLTVTPAKATDFSSNIPDRLKVVLEDLVDSQYTPEAKSVTISPEKPGPKDPIKITAKIMNDPQKTGRVPTEAWILYRTAPGEILISKEMTKLNDETFEVTIGPFEKGAALEWGLKAIDSGENMYVETACQVTRPWPPYGDNCLLEGAVDLDPDDSNGVIGPEMDIHETRFGEDKEKLYFEMTLEGKIIEGTINPPSIHAHLVGVINYDIARDDLLQGYLPIYAPLSRLVQIQPCSTIYAVAGSLAIDNNHIQCHVNENKLMFSITKQFFKNNPSGLLKFTMATGILINLDPIDGIPKDYAQVTTVRRINRTINIPAPEE